MHASQAYLAIAIVVLAIVALIAFFMGKNRANRLTPLAGFAFAFIIAAILFGENRYVGYGLMGIGVLLSVIDIVQRSKAR